MMSKKDILYNLDNGNIITLPKAFGYGDYYIDGHNTRLYDSLFNDYLTVVDTADETTLNKLKNMFINPSSEYKDYYQGANHTYIFELENISYITTETNKTITKFYPRYGLEYVTLGEISKDGKEVFINEWKTYLKQTNDPQSCLESEDPLCYLEKQDPANSLTPFRITLNFNDVGVITKINNSIYLKGLSYKNIFIADESTTAEYDFTALIKKVKHPSSIYTNIKTNNASYVFDLKNICGMVLSDRDIGILGESTTIYLDLEHKDKIISEWKDYLINTKKLNYINNFSDDNDNNYYINFLKVEYIYTSSETDYYIQIGDHILYTNSVDYNDLQKWLPFNFMVSYDYNGYNRIELINLNRLISITTDKFLSFLTSKTKTYMSDTQLQDLLNAWKQYLHLPEEDNMENYTITYNDIIYTFIKDNLCTVKDNNDGTYTVSLSNAITLSNVKFEGFELNDLFNTISPPLKLATTDLIETYIDLENVCEYHYDTDKTTLYVGLKNSTIKYHYEYNQDFVDAITTLWV